MAYRREPRRESPDHQREGPLPADAERRELERTARSLGAVPDYVDWANQRRKVSTDTLRAVVAALGRERAPGRSDRPVVVTEPGRVELATPVERAVIQGADGSEWPLPVTGSAIEVPAEVPVGVHRLALETGARQWSVVILRRPRPRPTPRSIRRTWGAFVAVHSLRASSADRGIGTLTDLNHLSATLDPWGPRLLSILPLFATEPSVPSPYSPVSQHFWNEAFLDLDQLADDLGLPRPAAAGPLPSRARATVDWPAVTDAVHRTLDRMIDELADRQDPGLLGGHGSGCPSGRDGFDLDELDAYCAFRAGGDGRAYHRHRLAQLAMEHQLTRTAADLRARGQGLVLDLPVGTSDQGFDVAHNPDLFVTGWSLGAPPDAFFGLGQRWGLPPLDPDRASATGHEYFGRSVAALARHSGAIRIDHVMGLERLWWIPPGASADDGVYVEQPSDELAARLAIEIHHNEAAVVGENLGTVPPTTAALLRAEGMLGMYEDLFAVGGLGNGGTLPPIPGPVVAGTGTHDMPTFAGFIAGSDIALLESLQDVAPDEVERLMTERRRDVDAWARQLHVPPQAPALLGATLRRLARSEAEHVLVNLDDLLFETRPLNVPGTGPERPNWQRRMRLDLDQLATSPSIRRHLATFGETRRGTA